MKKIKFVPILASICLAVPTASMVAYADNLDKDTIVSELWSELVSYFSASGVTAKVAEKLAKETNADIYEIKPAVPYTKADLNWQDKNSRSSIEMSDHNSRPEIADKNADISKYDTIYLGFPIWWYIAPTIINTFLESYDFSGKKIILFATSGGSGFGKTVQNLQSSASDSKIIEGTINPTSNNISEITKIWL